VARPSVGHDPGSADDATQGATGGGGVERARAQARESARRARLTTRRLLGLDRSGPPPPETLAGRPLRPWTIPNAIGYVRAALIPVFLVFSYEHGGHRGVDAVAAVAFFVASATDYADGMAARITGQYSRLGTLLDPVIDRLLVISGVVVCWSYELLPRWAIAVLLGRELLMLGAGRFWVRKGLEFQINWPGRIAVGPTMLGVFFGLVGLRVVGETLLYLGVLLALVATGLYFRSGMAQLRARRTRA
jgi:cardiolipin synthase